ncbi:MAG TPA: chaperone modulator CbpM [Blastocatellia bacterium]|nr:chaperone modulator CbpM [Blastocatellia bacterium]
MNESRFQITLCRVEHEQLTLDHLASCAGLHPTLVERYVEHGLIEPAQCAGSRALFDAECIPRLRAIERLRHDLGVNLAGVGVILDLLDRMARTQREVERLRGQL